MSMSTPGPISFLVPKTNKIPNYITADSDHVCIRIPSNTTALELLKKVKVPICAPSANIYCHVSPLKAEHVLSEFKNKKIIKEIPKTTYKKLFQGSYNRSKKYTPKKSRAKTLKIYK